ncbi:hypothetical protein [Mangrovicoccus sp. HB161399]|uniref:hypothetical protein n=1 Tax=Mangrovicoccus sp. HB161399 TaxID=2720392 RepID=UPI001556026F|nr:hypothetical protein [Mangrovicoccus sp. HB161399]
MINREYSLSEVAGFLGMNPVTVKSWAKHVPGNYFEGGGSAGKHRRFSFNALMQLAVVAELVKMLPREDFERAFSVAATFAYTDHEGREVGLPHHPNVGMTYMLVTDDLSHIFVQDRSTPDLSKLPVPTSHLKRICVLNLTNIFCGVASAVGTGGFAVLDGAYPKLAS